MLYQLHCLMYGLTLCFLWHFPWLGDSLPFNLPLALCASSSWRPSSLVLSLASVMPFSPVWYSLLFTAPAHSLLWVNIVVSWVLFLMTSSCGLIAWEEVIFLERNWVHETQFSLNLTLTDLEESWRQKRRHQSDAGFWHRNRKHNIRKQGLCWEFLW